MTALLSQHDILCSISAILSRRRIRAQLASFVRGKSSFAVISDDWLLFTLTKTQSSPLPVLTDSVSAMADAALLAKNKKLSRQIDDLELQYVS